MKTKTAQHNLKKTISESQLVQVIKEGILSTIGKKVDSFYRGFEAPEGKPQSVEDVFNGNGWKIKAISNGKTPNSTMYAVSRLSGAFGSFNGLQPKELEDDLNIFLQGKGKAMYIGKHPKYPYIEVFKVQY